MSTITNNQEMQVLNEILPFLIQSGKLSLNQIHREYVISHRCKKEDGSVDEDEARKLTGEYVTKGTYRVIADFLVDGKFANYYDNSPTDVIVITPKGEYLAAYGNLSAFNNAVNTKLSPSEIEERIPLLLPEVYPFSEFMLTPNKRQFLPQITGDELNDINAAIKKRQQMIKDIILKEHMDFIKDERVAEYLVHYGFAVNRLDIGGMDKLYRQLTDKGRKLKESGSLAAFRDWEQEEKTKEVRRKLLTDKVLELNIDNTEIQKSQMWFNFWIASGTIETCLFTADGLIRNQYNSIYPFFHHFALPFFALSAPILLAIRLALKLRRKRNTPQ